MGTFNGALACATQSSMSVQRSTLTQEAYSAIRADILSGRLPPGKKVVVRPLAEQLALSPTPIKNALAALEREGFLVAFPHRGYFVPEVSRSDMQEIYELREVIDGIAGRKAAASAGHLELSARLAGLLDAQRERVAHGNLTAYSDLDLAFHRAIWEAAGNARLLQAAENLLGQVRSGSGSSSRLPGRPARALDEHASIIAAITAGDAHAAEEATRTHVRLAGEGYDRYLADQENALRTWAPTHGISREEAT